MYTTWFVSIMMLLIVMSQITKQMFRLLKSCPFLVRDISPSNMWNMTGVNSGLGNAYPSGVQPILFFCLVIVCLLVLFPFGIALSKYFFDLHLWYLSIIYMD